MRLRQKFCDSHVKFKRNSYEFHTNFTFSEYSHISIHVKLARNSYEIRTKFVRIYVNFLRIIVERVVCGRRMVETLR